MDPAREVVRATPCLRLFADTLYVGEDEVKTAMLRLDFEIAGKRTRRAPVEATNNAGRVLESLNPNLAADAAILTRLDGAALFGDPAYNPADQRADALQGRVHGGFLRFVDSNHRGFRPAFPAPLADRVLSWCAAGDFVCDASGDDFSHYAASLAQQGLVSAYDLTCCSGYSLTCR